jgi:hypothetical protein
MPVGRSVPTVGEVSSGARLPEGQIYSPAPGIIADLAGLRGPPEPRAATRGRRTEALPAVGHIVRITMPSGEAETVYGFATEADAAKWIRQESQAWLYERKASRAKIAN